MSCRALAVALAVLVFTACDSAARKLEASSAATTCTRCHGDPARPDGAPPRDLHGSDDPTSISVGAHASHLGAPHRLAAPVPCEACHAVPASLADGHPDGRVEVVFGAVARPGGAPASWDRTTATCSVACHGATRPVWTRVDGSQAACGACHGNPPARPHPQRGDCRACHPATVGADGAIDVAGGRHVDGKLEVELRGCTDCHGDPDRAGADALARAAPPRGVGGEEATTDRAVGAHAAHLVAGNVGRPLACGECHAVPGALDHLDGAVDLAFGALARTGGATPEWDGASLRCAGTWCHGARLQGGDARAPAWTRVDGTQRRCGACHGAPPPAPHPADARCATCHPGTVRADGTIDLANGLHLNGAVDAHVHADGWSDPAAHGRAANRDLAGCRTCHGAALDGGAARVSCDRCHAPGWRTSCTFCHGEANRARAAAAPPEGTQGETSPADRAVGAHQAHLQDGPLRAAIACEECHAVPQDLSHVGGEAEVTFGALARSGGAAPRWEGGRCAATWCHGATLGGGRDVAPAWTGGAAEVGCDGCHGAPPPAPHPQLAACQGCHPETATSPTTIDVAGGKHVDGAVERTAWHPRGWSEPAAHGGAAKRDLASCRGCHGEALDGGIALVSCDDCHGAGWQGDCTFCHGDRTRAAHGAAPPRGTRGELAPTTRAVGAHEAHLSGARLGTPVACAECHGAPADLSHLDGSAALAFGPLARTGGASPGWDGARCASTYCHGATLQGGANRTPEWTRADGTQAACGTCHGRPPVTGPDVAGTPAHRFHTYRQNLACQTCHDGSTATSVAPGSHADGVRDVRVRHLVCVPQGCEPGGADCACAEEVSTLQGWDCAGCHSKFTF